MPRLPALLVLLALLLPAPASALAQSGGGAFGPIPPAQPAETPTPEPSDAGTAGDVSRQTLFLLALGVVVVFVGIGWWITRDARHSLTEADRAAVEGTRAGGPAGRGAPRKQDMAKMKERQRAKTRAQRQARKKTRRAGRG